jgi:hypothetical protein
MTGRPFSLVYPQFVWYQCTCKCKNPTCQSFSGEWICLQWPVVQINKRSQFTCIAYYRFHLLFLLINVLIRNVHYNSGDWWCYQQTRTSDVTEQMFAYFYIRIHLRNEQWTHDTKLLFLESIWYDLVQWYTACEFFAILFHALVSQKFDVIKAELAV